MSADKAEDVESQPIAKNPLKGSYTWVDQSKFEPEHHPPRSNRSRKGNGIWECCTSRVKEKEDNHGEIDTMTYNIAELSSWQAFCMWHGSAWDNPGLWHTVVRTSIVAVLVALMVGLGTPDPTSVRSDKFAKLSTFLTVFVGLLLSFFMSSSMNRWYTAVSAFLELFDAVRNLQMQCHALGVSRERESMLTRYGVLSSWLLHLQLVAQTGNEDEAVAKKHMWDIVMRDHPGLCEPEEKEILEHSAEPCQVIWTWVASLVGRMANDGDIPPMPTPTYGRILNIVQNAHGGIRQVRAAVCVQAPFIYIHTLAVLVHFNNVINAVSFGMTAGVTMGKFAMDDNMSRREQSRLLAKEAQNLTIAFFISMVGPFLYQALLEVSVCIAQPFNNEDAMIPTVRLLKSLERDLCECDYLSRHPPHWKEPAFKVPAAPAPAPAAPAAPAAPEKKT